jgi:hypothetical protein
MTTERQIAANRRNAKKSTGPRSASGKGRSGKNAYRHGLAVPLSSAEFETQLTELARRIAGDLKHAEILALAERAAHAQLELLRSRMVQTAVIEQALIKTSSNNVKHSSRLGIAQFRQAATNIEWLEKQVLNFPSHSPSRLMDPGLPVTQREWFDEKGYEEAFGKILPELNRIHRYARRAASRRDSAISKIMKAKKQSEAVRRTGPRAPKHLSAEPTC